jgi:hypothetical protein
MDPTSIRSPSSIDFPKAPCCSISDETSKKLHYVAIAVFVLLAVALAVTTTLFLMTGILPLAAVIATAVAAGALGIGLIAYNIFKRCHSSKPTPQLPITDPTITDPIIKPVSEPVRKRMHSAPPEPVVQGRSAVPAAVPAPAVIDFRSEDILGDSALIRAVAIADNAMAMEIMKTCPRGQMFKCLNEQSKNGNCALHLLIGKGYTTHSLDGQVLKFSNIQLARELLSKKPLVNLANKDGNTPLHLAVARRDIPAIELLISNGALLNTKNKKGQIPADMLNLNYIAACQLMKDTVGAFLLDERIFNTSSKEADALLAVKDIKEIDRPDKNGNTLLHMAAAMRDLAGIRRFMSQGANLQARNSNGQTPKDLLRLNYEQVMVILRASNMPDLPLSFDRRAFETSGKEADFILGS